MSMFNDIVWQAKENEAQCEHNSQTVADYARKFSCRHWSFLWPASEENGTEHILTNQMDPGIEWQNKCWQISLDPVILYFVPPVPLREENYEAKERKRSQYTSMVAMKPSNCFCAQ